MCNLTVVAAGGKGAAEDEDVEQEREIGEDCNMIEVEDEVELRAKDQDMKEEKAAKVLGVTIVDSLDTVHGIVQRRKRHRRLASDVAEPITL